MRIQLTSLAFAAALAAGPVAAEETAPAAPATPAAPASPAAPETPAAPAADKGSNKIVCKKEEAATGTRLGAKRVCKTEQEWRAIEEASQETLEDIQRRSTRTGTGQVGGN